MKKRYPFKFLDAYTRDDQAFFFGRDEEINELYKMVFQSDLILLYGASGTGKTSLIQCGLAGKFQSHDWLSLYIRRGKNLNNSLKQALDDAGADLKEEDEKLDWLNQDFAGDGTNTFSEHTLATSLQKIYLKYFKPIYLIFDQFEELYISGTASEQQAFIGSVKELLRVKQPVKLIISIREEYLGYLYEFEKEVPGLLRKKLRVEPMNLDKIKRVLNEVGKAPASNVRLKPGEEDEIGEVIFEKIKGEKKKLSIPLPYLQVFLDRFYLKITNNDISRESEAMFSLDELANMENIDDVLRSFLDEQVVLIANEFKQDLEQIWKLLSPFATLDGTKTPLSLLNIQDHFPEMPAELLSSLLTSLQKHRILRYIEAGGLYELAHDSLAQQVHSKRDDEAIAILELQRLITSQMSLIKSDSRTFLSEGQLKLVDLYKDKLVLNTEEKEYVKESRQEVDQQKNAKQRQKNIFWIVGLIIIVASFAITILLIERSDSKKKRVENERNQTIKYAQELMLYGDNYRDLSKDDEASKRYQMALDTLGGIDDSLRQTLEDRIGQIEQLE